MNQYETMFLFDPAFASDFGEARKEIERILNRANAKILFLEKWDERKLAYEIKGRKRGCYILTYFTCDGGKLGGIERDARLSEPILRILTKRADGLTRELMERFLPQDRAMGDEGRDEPGSEEDSPGLDEEIPRVRRSVGRKAVGKPEEPAVAIAERAAEEAGTAPADAPLGPKPAES